MVDKKNAIKLLGGTIARGIMWAAAALSAKFGVDAMSQDTAAGIGAFVAAILIAAASAWWSSRKDRKLLQTPPPK